MREARGFVAPPWRLADWSFAILAAIAGLLTALAVFVLIGTRGLPHEPLPMAASRLEPEPSAQPPLAAPAAAQPVLEQSAPPPTSPPPQEAVAPPPARDAPSQGVKPAASEERTSERAATEHRRARRERHRSRRD